MDDATLIPATIMIGIVVVALVIFGLNPRKTCPFCKKRVHSGASICPYCQSKLA